MRSRVFLDYSVYISTLPLFLIAVFGILMVLAHNASYVIFELEIKKTLIGRSANLNESYIGKYEHIISKARTFRQELF